MTEQWAGTLRRTGAANLDTHACARADGPVEPMAVTGPMAQAMHLRPRLDPHQLEALHQLRPWRVLADTGRCYALIGLAFVLLAHSDAWWAMLLAFVTIGTQQYALALVEHDGKHGLLLRSRRLNDLFAGLALCAVVGVDIDFRGATVRHGAHHRWLGTERDPIRRKYVSRHRATRARYAWFCSGLPLLPDDVAYACAVRHTAAVTTRIGQLVRRFAPVAAVQLAIFAAISHVLPSWYYATFWLAPIYLLVFLPSKLRTFCDHAQFLPDSAADHRRLISYRPALLERLFISPLGMHYHGEHHLWPSVPYYNLPALHRLIAGNSAIEVRGTYVGFLWGYFRSLPLARS